MSRGADWVINKHDFRTLSGSISTATRKRGERGINYTMQVEVRGSNTTTLPSLPVGNPHHVVMMMHLWECDSAELLAELHLILLA